MDAFLRALREPNSELNRYIHDTWCSKDPSWQQPHDIGLPATNGDLDKLRSSGGEDLIFLYEKCNGFRLCVPDESQGILIYSIAEIPNGNAEWKAWFIDDEEGELWDFQKSGLAFGEIAESGNYLVVHEGRVFYADHEGAELDDPWANSVSEFLLRIAEEPEVFLDRML